MKNISERNHTIIGLIVGLALILAPWLFGFSDNGGPAMQVPIYIGIFVILSELITTSPLSLIKLIPMKVHIMTDVITGLFLFISPWVFSFSNLEANAWVPHVIVGIAIVSYALMTRVETKEDSPFAGL